MAFIYRGILMLEGSSVYLSVSLTSSYRDMVHCLKPACVSAQGARAATSSSSATNFHPLSGCFCLNPTPLSSTLFNCSFIYCPLSNFLWFGRPCVCPCLPFLPPCVAFVSAISQGSAIYWRHCGWWVGQQHARLSSMETRWMMVVMVMMIRG